MIACLALKLALCNGENYIARNQVMMFESNAFLVQFQRNFKFNTFHFFRQMDIESAVKNLESFVELSEKSGDFREQQKACSAIGEMLNTLVRLCCNLL